jgi:hypothetical protein
MEVIERVIAHGQFHLATFHRRLRHAVAHARAWTRLATDPNLPGDRLLPGDRMAKIFDVEIERSAGGAMHWPASDEFRTDSGLGGNREYADMRRMAWREYREVAAYEFALVAQLENLDDDGRSDLLDALENDDEIMALMGLDPGVASVVIALSAARCAPFTSCNGGAFGDRHHEHYPIVGFFCREPLIPLLLACAEAASVGLVCQGGGLLVYSRTIADMMAFGSALHDHRKAFGEMKLADPRAKIANAGPAETDGQLDLFGS